MHRTRLISALLLCFAGCGDDSTFAEDGGTDSDTRDVRGLDAAPTDSDVPGEADSSADGGSSVPSPGCGDGDSPYGAGETTEGELLHDGLTRTFRVHVPPGYDASSPLPLVLMLHGGGGSGAQFERGSRMSPIADREEFIAVYPDGTGRIQTWNGGGCCGQAVTNDVDDVGFLSALLDHIEATLCVDQSREFASGMSNGAIMTHRLACELSERFAALAPVAGTEMSPTCTPARPVALMHVHGTADGHVPFEGGEGCGPAGVAFTSVPATMDRRRTLNGCDEITSTLLEEGDGTCQAYEGCDPDADVVLCQVADGGHNWPGGEPPAGLVSCPGNGGQSTTFIASEVIWRFFSSHRQP